MHFEPLTILFQDNYLVIVRKPSGLHVHPTALSPGEASVLKILRDQRGEYLFPVHRLDRATSGPLVFARSQSIAALLGSEFQTHKVAKLYLALVRGWAPDDLVMDCSLDSEKAIERESLTRLTCIEKYELPFVLGDFSTVRASLVLAQPKTGRRHQIRRHCSRANHPVLGDTGYGDRHHNHFYTSHFGLSRLQLFAAGIGFVHPHTGQWLKIVDNCYEHPGNRLNIFEKFCLTESHSLSEVIEERLTPSTKV